MYKSNQQIIIRVQCDTVMQFIKKADFLKSAVGFVRHFVLRSSVLAAVRRRIFLL